MSMWKQCSLHEVVEIERDSLEAAAITDGTLYVGLENIESGGSFVNVRSIAMANLPATSSPSPSAMFSTASCVHTLQRSLGPALTGFVAPTSYPSCRGQSSTATTSHI